VSNDFHFWASTWLPRVLFVVVFFCLFRKVFFQKSAKTKLGEPRFYTRREKIGFVVFIVVGALAFFFDPFPKNR
jgi:hypothetical protein